MTPEILKELKTKGFYKNKLGKYELLPRRKGGVFGNKRDDGKEKKIRYSKRIKFTAFKPLKDKVCK